MLKAISCIYFQVFIPGFRNHFQSDHITDFIRSGGDSFPLDNLRQGRYAVKLAIL